MSRIRSIHPGIYTDEAWASVSIVARWFAKGICTEADDNGVFEWKPLQLKMRIFPADGVDVPALLAELKAAGIVCSFEADGKHYGALRNFCKYQRPRKPKAWFPITDEVREFVALGAPPAADEDEEPAVPKKSELTVVEPAPVPPKSEKSPQMEDGGGRRKVRDADASLVPSKGTTIWDDAFAEAWDAYPKSGRDRSMSRTKCWPLWREAAQQAGGSAKLLAAVKRYARDDKGHKGDCGAPAFDRWLKWGRWEHWLAGPATGRTLAVFPDPEIRGAVTAARGEAWVASWLDPCTWDPETRVIVPRTLLAASKLRSEVGGVLRSRGVTILEKDAA